jgi:transposase
VKTDRRDARTLADACRLGAYRATHRTSAAQRTVRAQLAVREALVRTRTRYISVLRAVLRRDGVRVPSGGAATFGQRVQTLTVGDPGAAGRPVGGIAQAPQPAAGDSGGSATSVSPPFERG